MVTRITSGKDVKGALYYNEKKVASGTAQCIQASGFMKAPAELTFDHKLKRFMDLNKRNVRTKTNTMHISINFHKSESYPLDVLNSIASSYMEKIGFGDQPFLVYEHFDAAHQHMHIVTTLIQEDGKRIPINKIGMNESEKARKEIEVDFQLMKAQEQGKLREELVAPMSKAVYGSSETKRSISDIVRYITHTYRFTSIAELNTLLKKYNILADTGKEGSAMFNKKGLVYSILDDKGHRIGVPIKASRLSFKPTLPWLEKRFEQNEKLRVPFREAFSKKVFDAIDTKPISLEQLQTALQKANVELVTRIAKDGRIFGITFIDHTSHTIFNGSDLSKKLTAKTILEKLAANKDNQPAPSSALVNLGPYAWKRISTPVDMKRVTDQKRSSSRESEVNDARPYRSKNPSQFQLHFDELPERNDYLSKAEYMWTSITMTYGAGMHTSADPLGFNRKKKKKKKRRAR